MRKKEIKDQAADAVIQEIQVKLDKQERATEKRQGTSCTLGFPPSFYNAKINCYITPWMVVALTSPIPHRPFAHWGVGGGGGLST